MQFIYMVENTHIEDQDNVTIAAFTCPDAALDFAEQFCLKNKKEFRVDTEDPISIRIYPVDSPTVQDVPMSVVEIGMNDESIRSRYDFALGQVEYGCIASIEVEPDKMASAMIPGSLAESERLARRAKQVYLSTVVLAP